MWQDIKEVLSIVSNLVLVGLVVAVVAYMIRGWKNTAHLTNFSERFVRVDGRMPYTLQVTVIPEFPVFGGGLGMATSGDSNEPAAAQAA